MQGGPDWNQSTSENPEGAPGSDWGPDRAAEDPPICLQPKCVAHPAIGPSPSVRLGVTSAADPTLPTLTRASSVSALPGGIVDEVLADEVLGTVWGSVCIGAG